jgi:hypothetical protein
VTPGPRVAKPARIRPAKTLQYSLALPLQVYTSAVAFGVVDADASISHKPTAPDFQLARAEGI